MTADLLARLETGFETLVDALDGQDPDRIIEAASALRPMVIEIENTGIWHDNHAIKSRLLLLSKLIDGARFRVNKLTNLNQQRAINLAHALGDGISPTYDKLL